jgi:hypothetical protein
MDEFVIAVLGLEESLWAQISTAEQRKYSIAVFLFAILSALCMLASFVFIYMITSALPAVIIGGLILSFILISMIRFSLISLRKSVFDNPNIQEVAEAASKPLGFFQKIKSKFKNLFRFKPITANSAIPGLAMAIRIFFMGVIAMLIIFPLACLLNYNSIQQINIQKRSALVQAYQQQLAVQSNIEQKSLLQKIALLNNQIKNYKGFYYKNSLGQKLQESLAQTKAAYAANLKQEAINQSQALAQYQKQIANSYYPVLSFYYVYSTASFWLVLGIVCYLLFYPHFLIAILNKFKIYQYANLAIEKYRKSIDEDYANLNLYSDRIIKKKYPNLFSSIQKNDLWADYPYKTIMSYVPAVRKPIKNLDL